MRGFGNPLPPRILHLTGKARQLLPRTTLGRVPAGIDLHRLLSLKTHRSENLKLSQDPLSIEKVRDIVGLYLHAPEGAAVLCVDEKSQIQALDRTQPLLPMRPDSAQKQTHDHRRHLAVRCLERCHRGGHRPLLPQTSFGRRVHVMFLISRIDGRRFIDSMGVVASVPPVLYTGG